MAATTENVAIDEEANGPEDIPLDWASIDWRQVEADVRRLRQRIFRASHATDPCKIRTYVLSPSHDLSWAAEQVDARSARRLSYLYLRGSAPQRGLAAAPLYRDGRALRSSQAAEGLPRLVMRTIVNAPGGLAGQPSRCGAPARTLGGNVMIHAARGPDLTQRL
jgi:hypothetical protein